MDCLTLMNNNSTDIFSCGIEKLTSGAGGCSDYSEIDVLNEIGSRLNSLRDDCRLMDSEGGLTKGCNKCLKTWREIAYTSKNDSMKLEDDICRFSMLILLTSQRVADESWIDKIFHCLGDNSLPLASSADESGNETIRSTKFKTDESYSEESSYRRLSLKEIYSATDSLSMSNFIGQGIAGKVYKGILADRQHVAIKHIIKDEQMETFVREVTSLSHIKHPNLVSLLGHYDAPIECFLVYELCHNGNLSEWLFGKSKYLSWRRRLEIALDCARGLLFLHSYPQGSIVHRDIKPANILLSASFEAKLSDFGLSKIISIGHSYASSEVRGTYGYVDPEYQKNRHVNSYGDVYSFGIVLLQLLSGQRVINLDLKNPMPLSKMAKNLTKGGNIKEFADLKLEGKFSMEAFELVLKLALTSIGLKQQRPSMEQVVVKLEEALDLSTRVESVHP
uniref:non-specific serine/threonine protein kinase n=1 Tax=Solanum tuberosum TaxID=4113 RepID=M0ZY60_SOLTU